VLFIHWKLPGTMQTLQEANLKQQLNWTCMPHLRQYWNNMNKFFNTVKAYMNNTYRQVVWTEAYGLASVRSTVHCLGLYMHGFETDSPWLARDLQWRLSYRTCWLSIRQWNSHPVGRRSRTEWWCHCDDVVPEGSIVDEHWLEWRAMMSHSMEPQKALKYNA